MASPAGSRRTLGPAGHSRLMPLPLATSTSLERRIADVLEVKEMISVAADPSVDIGDGLPARTRSRGSVAVLTKKSTYGLKAMLYLAREAGNGPVPVARIAEREHLPRKFLEAILLDLTRHGVLRSKRGPGGGYALVRGPEEVTLGEIIGALDPPRPMVSCLDGHSDARCTECAQPADCRIRTAMTAVHAAAARVLDRTTLSVLASEQGRDDASRPHAVELT